jgi:hypothetical protein
VELLEALQEVPVELEEQAVMKKVALVVEVVEVVVEVVEVVEVLVEPVVAKRRSGTLLPSSVVW